MLWPFQKCLFLGVQQAEVLLNFFGECILELELEIILLSKYST